MIIIDKGKIVFDGKLADIIEKYADHKVLSVVFQKGVRREELAKVGSVVEYSYPKAVIKVPRHESSRRAAEVILVICYFVIQGEVVSDFLFAVQKNLTPPVKVEFLIWQANFNFRSGRRVKHPEHVQVGICPSRGILDNAVQIPKSVGFWNLNPSPDRGLAVFQGNSELIYLIKISLHLGHLSAPRLDREQLLL